MSTAAASQSPNPPPEALPWWRYRMVWFVLGLPALVVLSSLVTAGIAWRYADTVVTEPGPEHANAGTGVNAEGRATGALQPAVQARNHAATPQR